MKHPSSPSASLDSQQAHAARQNTGQIEQPFLRLEFRRSLQMHWRLTVLIAALGLLASAAYVALRWPVYTAQSVVYIQPSAPQLLGKDGANSWPNDANAYDTFIQQKVQSASNPSLLLNALHRLPANSWQRANESEQAAALRLGRATVAKRMGTSYQISITAKAHNSEQAAQIANAVANAIVDNSTREASAGNNERIAALDAERIRVQKSLDADRAEQDAINARLGIASIGTTTPNHYDADIAQLHESLIKARADREEAAARLSAMKGGANDGLNAEADEQLNSDLGLVGLKTSLNQRRATLIAQMANLTPNHPLYRQDADELAHIDATLDGTLKQMRAVASARIQQKLRTELTRTTELEERLNAQLARMAGTAAGATPEMQRANDLAADIARLQNRYGAIDEQRNNLNLASSTAGAASLASAAIAPQKPDAMAVLHIAVPVAIFGLLMGLLAALLAHNFDPRIYTAADVERILGYAPMGQLPDFQQVSANVAEDHLLRLAAALEHAWQQGAIKNCILTSCTPGAGTSLIAARIKDLFEELGRPTLLVRASSAQTAASSSGLGGESTSPGLMTTRQVNRSMTMLQKLTEDAEPAHPGQEAPRLVLTDTAPLLISAETEYLARYADATILIVESGVTTGEQLHKAVETLQRLHASAIGIVLNRVRLQHADRLFSQTVHLLEKKFASSTGPTSATPWDSEQTPPEVPCLAEMAATPQSAPLATPPAQRHESLPDTRLSGLRKLAFEQRLEELCHHDTEPPYAVAQHATAQPSIPLITETDRRSTAPPSPEAILSESDPVILPPQEEEDRTTPARVWSWKTNSYRVQEDDVHILPSLPGQYRKRKS